jgi:hypothetical protein
VKLLILQEKFAPFSYSGRVSLLFGERSSYHPKFSYVMPQMGWRKYYTNYLSMTTIAGGHGEFFKEPNILSLTSAISKQIQLANNDSFDENIPKQPNTLQILGKPAYEYQISYPETLEAKLGETLNVSISFKNMSPIKWLPHNSSGLALYARWFTSSNTFLKHDGYMPLKDSVSSQETLDTHLHLVAPSQLGSFILQFDLVDEGVSWFRDKSPCIRVNVNP